MNRSTGDTLQTLKNRSSDENSKKTEKRKSLEQKRKSKQFIAVRPIDMKPVKVLVERTKFNEMQVLDHSRGSIKSSPLVNGSLEKKQGRGRKPGSKIKKSEKKVLPHKTHIDKLFQVRRCYVKIPKDKVLIRQLAKFGSPRRPQKRPRGRPKKERRRSDDVESSPTSASTSGLKRKSTADGEVDSPPKRNPLASDGEENSLLKRKSKAPGFFINISALTRTPSPRRKFTIPTQSDSPKKAKPKKQKPATKKLDLVALRRKFGTRFFKSYVKVRRFTDGTHATVPKPKKKSGKNLSVSFLETVEIFGESTDSEDWVDYDEGTPSPAKGSRLKPLENGDNSGPSNSVKPVSTSTPRGDASGSPNATARRKKGGILKRKEKISFSPLKEDESSPRKEQLKRSNEKIVRLSYEQRCADEDEQPETSAAAFRRYAADAETPPDAPSDTDEDERNDSTEANMSLSMSPIRGRMTPPTAPPASEEQDKQEEQDSTEHENVQKTETENNDNISDNVVSTTTPVRDEESFESAKATSNLEETANPRLDEEEKEISEKLQFSDTEDENPETEKAAEISAEPYRSDTTSVSAHSAKELSQQEQEQEQANQVNISNNSDQHFEDASDLVPTVMLSNSTEDDRNEAEAVLNDVCQIAAAESAALLNATDVDYNSRPNDDEDDDYTSVLTHPEVERSLQSAASTLVPNSQEIVVAAAAVAASQVTDVDVTEDTFDSVVAEVERFTKGVNPGIYSDDVGITGADVMMDNVQASNSLDIFDDDDVHGQSHMFLHFPDDIISSLRMSSGSIDIGHDKSLPIQVIETEVMAIPNEPDIIFDKPLGTTASILGTSMSTTNDTLAGHGHCSTVDTNSKLTLGRIFQSVKSYVMSPGGDKNAALQD